MKLISKKYSFIALILFSSINLNILNIKSNTNCSQEICTLYGNFVVTEPVLLELISSKSMQRLALINQYGVDYYTYKNENYNRFEHSIGVCMLTRKYGANLFEQIAALLHDVSHTAFSHVADYIYKSSDLVNAYQDDIIEQFINNCELKDILNKYGIAVCQILPKNKEFKILEAEIPEINADRLEYNLRGGLIQNLLAKSDIDVILNSLNFSNGRWFFTNISHAKKFAMISLYLTEHRWGSPEGMMRNIYASQAFRRANQINLISFDEFNLGTDNLLWDKLVSSDDVLILDLIKKMKKVEDTYILSDKDYDLFLKNKFRGINPWVSIDNKFYRLSEVDLEFKSEFERIKNLISVGLKIKFK